MAIMLFISKNPIVAYCHMPQFMSKLFRLFHKQHDIYYSIKNSKSKTKGFNEFEVVL